MHAEGEVASYLGEHGERGDLGIWCTNANEDRVSSRSSTEEEERNDILTVLVVEHRRRTRALDERSGRAGLVVLDGDRLKLVREGDLILVRALGEGRGGFESSEGVGTQIFEDASVGRAGEVAEKTRKRGAGVSDTTEQGERGRSRGEELTR